MSTQFDKMTEVIAELKRERDDAHEALIDAHAAINELRRRVLSQHRYIEALERQLEPSVIAEIKAELEAQAHEE